MTAVAKANPDIEIYVAEDLNAILGWLRRRFGVIADPSTRQRQNMRVHRTHTTHGNQRLPILIVEGGTEGFSSILFESDASPWQNDLECAREATKALGCEVRCCDGPWQPGQPEETLWWSLSPNGERRVHWQ